MPSTNTTPRGFTALPSEILLKIAGHLHDLCTEEHKQDKKSFKENPFKKSPTGMHIVAPHTQHTDILAFCQVSKACVSVGQEILVRHCDLTGVLATSRTILLAQTLLEKPGLRSKVLSLKIDLTFGVRDDVAGVQMQHPSVLPAMLQYLSQVNKPESHEQKVTMMMVSKILESPEDPWKRETWYVALFLLTSHLRRLHIDGFDGIFYNVIQSLNASALQMLETIILRGKASASVMESFQLCLERLSLPSLKVVEMRRKGPEMLFLLPGLQGWIETFRTRPVFNAEVVTIRGWLSPPHLSVYLYRFPAIKVLHLVIDDMNDAPVQTLWPGLVHAQHTLEVLTIRFKCKDRSSWDAFAGYRRYVAIWPLYLSYLYKLKTFEISGDFLPDRRLVVPNIEPSAVGPDYFLYEFLPPNLERFVFAPNLLTTIDAKYKNPYGKKWWSQSFEYDWRAWILVCFGRVLRNLHEYRPGLKTVEISSDVFCPETASIFQRLLARNGVELTIQT
jgi:hypothetical protein